MATVVLTVAPPPPVRPEDPFRDTRSFWLESLDGSVQIPIAGDGHDGEWVLQAAMTGAGVPPVIVDRRATPGMVGSYVGAVTVVERTMLIPIDLHSTSLLGKFTGRDTMFELTDPSTGMFRLVCSSSAGTREVTLVYLSGFEGDESGSLPWFSRFVLQCVGTDPYARDSYESSLSFGVAAADEPFLADAGADHPWPRRLTSTTVIGEGMRIDMPSSVPVYPTIEVGGPYTSFDLSSDTGLQIASTVALGAGEVLRIVTDPRAKSIRVDGEPAASRITRGSTLAPFKVGQNLVNVAVPGGTDETFLRLTWRGGYRSLW